MVKPGNEIYLRDCGSPQVGRLKCLKRKKMAWILQFLGLNLKFGAVCGFLFAFWNPGGGVMSYLGLKLAKLSPLAPPFMNSPIRGNARAHTQFVRLFSHLVS